MLSTYQSVLDRRSLDDRLDYDALADVSAPDDRTVVFRLKHPYAPFAQRLLLGICPAQALRRPRHQHRAVQHRPSGHRSLHVRLRGRTGNWVELERATAHDSGFASRPPAMATSAGPGPDFATTGPTPPPDDGRAHVRDWFSQPRLQSWC